MSEGLYKSYIISKLNMEILLNRIGCMQIYGLFDSYSEANVQKEDVYLAVSEMIKKKILIPAEESLVINQDIREILELMKSSLSCVKISSGREDYGNIICYMGKENVVVMSASTVRKEMLNVSKIPVEVFYGNYTKDILPEPQKDIGFLTDNLDMEKENSILISCRNGLLQSEVLICFDFLDSDGIIKNEMLIIDNLLDRYAIECKDEDIVRLEYTDKELFIKILMEENDNDNG